MERKDFELEISGQKYYLKVGNFIVWLIRNNPDLDHLHIAAQEDKPERKVYHNQDLARWLGGLSIKKEIDGFHHYDMYYIEDEGDEEEWITFRDMYGWNPPVIILDDPLPRQLQEYIQTQDEEKLSQFSDEDWK